MLVGGGAVLGPSATLQHVTTPSAKHIKTKPNQVVRLLESEC